MIKLREQFPISQDASFEKSENIVHFYENLERLGVDSGIKDIIVYLHALGFHTTESCEGHLDRGTLAPRVGIEAPGKPRWRFLNQKETFEKAAERRGVTVEEIFEYVAPKYGVPIEDRAPTKHEEQIMRAWAEGWARTPQKEETEYFTLWRMKTDKQANDLDTLLREFYQGRTAAENTKLVIEKNNKDAHVYNFFLHNGGKDYALNLNPHELGDLSKEEMNARKRNLELYQREMKDFMEFLKNRFEKEKSA